MSDGERDFERIYKEFRPRIRAYLARLVGQHEAEDLTQTVFHRVSQALKDFRGESRISTWVYRIATNVAADWLRSSSFRQVVQQKPTHVSACREEADAVSWSDEGTPPADQLLVRREMNQCIRDTLEELPEDYREVIALSEIEGLKNAEIAETLGVGIDTVKIRLHRARGKLRMALEARCTFHRDERHALACDRKGCP
jgi:RNA polymerase sigma-70 factor (ECF subfamily)